MRSTNSATFPGPESRQVGVMHRDDVRVGATPVDIITGGPMTCSVSGA